MSNDRLVQVLNKAIEYCESHNVFDPVHGQPPFATLLGLIIAQGRRFSVSRAIRRKLWTCMGEKLFSAKEFLAREAAWPICESDAKRWLEWQNEKGIGPWTRAAHRDPGDARKA